MVRLGHVLDLLVTAAISIGAVCSCTSGVDHLPQEAVGHNISALTTGPLQTIQNVGGYDFVENFVSIYTDPSTRARTPIVLADMCPPSGTNNFYFTCGNSSYNTWTGHEYATPCVGDVSIAEGNGGQTYMAGINSGNINVFAWSGDACTATHVGVCVIPGYFDYPFLVSDWTRGKMWLTATSADTPTGPQLHLNVFDVTNAATSCSFTEYTDPTTCTHGDNILTPNASVGPSGYMQIVYADTTDNTICKDQFNPATGGWQCGGSIGPLYMPASTGCSCGTGAHPPVVPGLGNGCVRTAGTASIAIDPNTKTQVVTYNDFNSGATKVETRWYYYTASTGWVYTAVTGGSTNAWPRVAHASTLPWSYGTSGYFQTHTTYVTSGAQGDEATYVSVDNGVHWNGYVIWGPHSYPSGGAYGSNSCYYGDFNGIAYSVSDSWYMHTWTDWDSTNGWTTRGMTASPY